MSPHLKSNKIFRYVVANIDSFIIAIVGFVIILLFTQRSGVGISPDSIVYTSVARNINAGKGLMGYGHIHLIDFPAFYPIFLSVIIFITKTDTVVFGAVLNALLFAVVIFVSGSITQKFINVSRPYKIIILLCIAISPSLIEVYAMLWSETLFIVLLLLFIIAIKKYFNSHTVAALLVMSFIAALAFVTRYAGITLIGCAGLLLLFDKNLKWKKKMLHIIVFSLCSSSLLIINITRNYLRHGHLTGDRLKSITSLQQNIAYYGNVICDWLPFFNGNYSFAFIIASLLILIIAIVFTTKRLKQFSFYYSYENIALAYFITYSVFIIGSATLSRYEPINSRLISPMFICFLWSISYWIPKLIKKQNEILNKYLSIILFLFITISLIRNEFLLSKDLYEDASNNGVPGYTDDLWKYSPTANYLKQNNQSFEKSYTVYSNGNEAVYFFGNMNGNLAPSLESKKERYDEFINSKKVYLVWFNNVYDNNPALLQRLLSLKKWQLVQQFKDGVIYKEVN